MCRWDNSTNEFFKVEDNDGIRIQFPSDSKEILNAEMVIDSYMSAPMNSSPQFPLSVKGTLYIDGKIKLTVTHQAKIEDNLPLEIRTKIEGVDF